MKIRNGFVSNSSSSSFVFLWKGEATRYDLMTLLQKHAKRFEIKAQIDGWAEDETPVMKAEFDGRMLPYFFEREAKIVSIHEPLKNARDALKYYEKELKKSEKDPCKWAADWDRSLIKYWNKVVDFLQEAKEKGMAHCMSFAAGSDCEGLNGYIFGSMLETELPDFIKTKDVYMWKENNH